MQQNVGIVTLGGNFNYGNRLQLYATYTIYASLGLSAEALVPPCRSPKGSRLVRKAKNTVKHLLGRSIEVPPERLMPPERIEAFKAFSSLVPERLTSEAEIAKLQSQYDFFSVGSDQVWNPYYFDRYEDWFFLQFARPEQRIALAPSIGLDSLDDLQRITLKDGVSGFSRLSIREERGAELIEGCSGMHAQVICDPSLVVSADHWRDVSNGFLTPAEPYVFTYLLGGSSKDSKAVLSEVTHGGHIPVVALTDRSHEGEPPAGPAEFIDFIDRANHVVTDSFHAAAFSCILGTPLTIVRRSGTGYGMFSRLESLAHALGIEDKAYGTPGFDISLAGNYDGVDERIIAQRNAFLSYLRGCISA